MKCLYLIFLLLFLSIAPIVVLTRYGLPVSSGDIRALFPFQSHTLTSLERMESTFGESLFDAVIVKLPSTTIGDETIDRLSALRDDLGELPGVLSVFSPVEGLSRLGIPVRVITADRQFGRYLVEIDSSLNDQQRSALDISLQMTLKRYSEFDPIRAGAFSVSEDATNALALESRVWTPVCVAVVILLTILIFRDLRATVAVLFAPFVSILWLFAGLVLLDIKLLPVAQMVPPLLLGLGASYSVFIACRQYDARAHNRLDRIHGTTASTVLACITTIAGFVALIPLDTRAVAQFGTLMTVGTLMAGVLSVWLVPLLLPVDERTVERAATSLRRLVVTRVFGMKVLVLFALGSSILAGGARYLAIDTSPLDFLPVGSPGRLGVDAALQRFPGSHQLFVSLYRSEPFGELDVGTVQRFESSIGRISGVRGVTSLSDFVELDDRIKSHALVQEGGSLVEMRFGPSTVTSENRKATRLFVETDDEGQALMALRTQIDELGADLKTHGIMLEVSSRELVMAEQSDALARGLLYSVLSALGLVGFLLFAIFRTIRLVIIGLLPSLLPIAAVFGGLGFISGQVNMGTAMVAAVALGMVSDNTFHYLIAWRARREQAPSEILELSSGSMIATAVVLIGGFCPTMLSALPPMNQFGLLLSVCVLLGLSANLFVLPGLVARFGVSRQRGSRAR